MKYLTTALALIASPALADITPAQLLESWRTTVDRMQFDLTIGAQTYDGEVLVLTDVQVAQRNSSSQPMPSMDWVRLAPLPDGAVSIRLSSVENPGVTTSLPMDPYTKITTSSRYDGLEVTATGSPDKVTYHLAADRFEFGQLYDNDPFYSQTAVVFSGISVRYSQWENAQGNLRSEGEFSADTVNVEWTKTQSGTSNPEEGETSQVGTLSLSDLSMPFGMTAPAEYFTNLDTPTQGIPEGMTMDTQILAKQAALHIDGGDWDPDSMLDISASDSEVSVIFGDTDLRYLFDFSQIALATNVPLDSNQRLAVSMDKLLLDIAMPFRKSGVAAPFALATRLENVEMGSAAWDIFDPNSEMARVPASLDLQITGEVTMLVDLLNPEKINAQVGPPFELHALSLERFDLQGENAVITGAGHVVIDNNTIVEATGMPAATGSLDFSLTGALAFLDRLGRLPNIDPLMAIGAKGALGMFATPTSEADSFTSHIEFTDGGHISVNGQQVN